MLFRYFLMVLFIAKSIILLGQQRELPTTVVTIIKDTALNKYKFNKCYFSRSKEFFAINRGKMCLLIDNNLRIKKKLFIKELENVTKMQFSSDQKLLFCENDQKIVTYNILNDKITVRKIITPKDWFVSLDPLFEYFFDNISWIPAFKYNRWFQIEHNKKFDYDYNLFLSKDSSIYMTSDYIIYKAFQNGDYTINRNNTWISSAFHNKSQILATNDSLNEIIYYNGYGFLFKENLISKKIIKYSLDINNENFYVFSFNDKIYVGTIILSEASIFKVDIKE